MIITALVSFGDDSYQLFKELRCTHVHILEPKTILKRKTENFIVQSAELVHMIVQEIAFLIQSDYMTCGNV